MAECNVVLQMKVNGEILHLDTKFTVPPPVGTFVGVVPAYVNYTARHSVTKVDADPYTGQYVVLLANAGSELSSDNAAKFSLVLQSYGWKKL